MMKKTIHAITVRWSLPAAFCMFGLVAILIPVPAAHAQDTNFDHKGREVFKNFEKTPEANLTADSGGRTLNTYYERRQYPGSPPRIPHHVEPAFGKHPQNCLSCHASGGFSPEHRAFIPVTPHPQFELCFQCHVPLPKKDAYFSPSGWKSIRAPKLGKSALPGSPPIIPHSLQLRENCISCHTGPGAVAEIRIEHAVRGNCRQCHAPMVSTKPEKIFSRKRK